MIGCLRNILAGLGCFTVILVGAIFGWRYRSQLTDAYYAFRGEPTVERFVAGPGRPSPEARESARIKQLFMARGNGPEFMSMSTAEMASLIQDGLDPLGRRALDSLLVTFEEGRFELEAGLLTEVWGRRELGILGGLLRAYEPLRVAGPVWIERPGVLAWEPDQLSVRSIPFPRPTVSPIVNRLTGGKDGIAYFPVPRTVVDVSISPEAVTFYRRIR